MTDVEVAAVDLFCGVGGLTHGLERSGVRVVAGVDVDPACAYPYSMNNGALFVERDIESLESGELRSWFGDAHNSLIAGCAPCQPFSSYSRPRRSAQSEQDWRLIAAFGQLVAAVRPDYVTMENVPHLVKHRVFRQFLDALSEYHTAWDVVHCIGFGVPQTRSRLVFVASLHGPIELPVPADTEATPTVRSSIGELPSISAGGVDPTDPIHRAPRLSDLNLRRIRASKPGGTWHDWPEHLRAACHRRQSGETFANVYGRMEWDTPSPTITTQCFGFGNGRFGHPEQNRAISLREASMLQTFPRSYAFVPPGEQVRFNRLGRLIGNAVPVNLGEAVGRTILEHASGLTDA